MTSTTESERTNTVRIDPHSGAFTILLGSLVTLASFATDMGLPVLAETARSLGVTPGAAALTLSVFLAGFAIGPLVFGPLSDHFGRRPVLLTGCAMFACFGALGAFSRSLHALLLWRTLMGIGAGGCQVLVLAIVRDLFVGAEARVKQSYVNLAGGVAPIIAPTLGIAIATMGGWRAIYAALAIGGIVLFTIAYLVLVESGRRGAPGALTVRGVVDSYVRVLRHPVALGYVLVIALNFGSLFAYVSGSSLVLIGLLGVSRRTYGILFAATSLGLMAGALTSARLSARGVSQGRLIRWGLAVIVGSSLVLLVLTLAGWLRAPTLVGLVIVGFVGQGIVRPNASQGALEPMSSIAGVASAVMSGTQMLTGALASALVAALFDGRSAIAVTGMMALCASLSAVVYARVVRPAERRLAMGAK
ncbi:MAG TPA: multidrug effflux MFS transporter [Gemmatimonadaceae bacterium]|jgi:DHA1 family bicyclomycin/chloramphenicol resistance-like MFS transporter|nr:multidrug effflux MFS transporter [Gemmatimonadaceae bacterium]